MISNKILCIKRSDKNESRFYSGSFDPFTNGHLHIVKASCQIFDKVIVGIE